MMLNQSGYRQEVFESGDDSKKIARWRHFSRRVRQSLQAGAKPGNSAILLETGSCAIILTRGDSQSRDALRTTKKILY